MLLRCRIRLAGIILVLISVLIWPAGAKAKPSVSVSVSGQSQSRIKSVDHSRENHVNAEEDEAKTYLETLNTGYTPECAKLMLQRWNYLTNITFLHGDAYEDELNHFMDYKRPFQKYIRETFPNWETYNDEKVKRAIDFYRIDGPNTATTPAITKVNKFKIDLMTHVATAKICEYNSGGGACTLRLQDVEQKMESSTDFHEQLYYWTEWHDKISASIKPSPDEFVQKLIHEKAIAEANGLPSICAYKSKPYEITSPPAQPDLPLVTAKLWEEVQPLYNRLFAYVRMKLRENPEYRDQIKRYGYIPAHLMGTIGSTDWSGLHRVISPCIDCPSVDDISAEISKKFPTVKSMADETDKYLTTMSFPSVQEFMDVSELELKATGDKICDASAENLCTPSQPDFRINACSKRSWKDLQALHEKGFEIEYFQSYNGLPDYIFRDPANPSFHGALGKALSLSMSSPYNLKCVLKLELAYPGTTCPVVTPPTTAATTIKSTTDVQTTTEQYQPTTESGSTVTQDNPTTDVQTTTEQYQPTTESGSTVTQDNPTTDVQTTTEQYQPTTESGSTVTQDNPTTDVQTTTEQYQPTTESGSTVTQDNPTTDVQTTTEQYQPTTESGSTVTQDNPTTDEGSSTSSDTTDGDTSSSTSEEPLDLILNDDLPDEDDMSPYMKAAARSSPAIHAINMLPDNKVADQNDDASPSHSFRSDSRSPTSKAESTSSQINSLLLHALHELPSLPFFHAFDEWLQGTCNNPASPLVWNDLNKDFWNKRSLHQGLIGDQARNNKFDMFVHSDLLADLPLYRSFLGKILQFQLFQGICVKLDLFDPNDGNSILSHCDLSGHPEVGPFVLQAMEIGFSKSWEHTLEQLTGTKNISSVALLNYFKLLSDFIKTDLESKNELECIAEHCLTDAEEYLAEQYDKVVQPNLTSAANAEWTYALDLGNPELERIRLQRIIALAGLQRQLWSDSISQFEFEEPEPGFRGRGQRLQKVVVDDTHDVRRQIKLLLVLGTPILPDSELLEYHTKLINMSTIHRNAKICPYDQRGSCSLDSDGISIESGIPEVFAESTNYDELSYTWKAIRDSTGKPVIEIFEVVSNFSIKIAAANGFENNIGEYWLRQYEPPSTSFRPQIAQAWSEIRALYIEVHAFVRHRLSQQYSEIQASGLPIPSHLLGTPWSDNWENIYRLVKPFDEVPDLDVTDALLKRFPNTEAGIRRMFQHVNSFFASLGLEDMTDSYGPNAMIARPSSGEVVDCVRPSTWDFSNGDFRVKMCTNVTMADFLVVHAELSKIQYYTQYNKLALAFKQGANPAFMNAVGGAVKLLASTPHYMLESGLVDQIDDDMKSQHFRINFALKMAFSQITRLPFLYGLDTYRLGLLDGSISQNKSTYDWLRLNSDFQGITPPVKRSEQDFDAGALHGSINGEEPAIHDFVAIILQFQILENICNAAGKGGSLYDCEVSGELEAGTYLSDLMGKGATQKWWELLAQSNATLNTAPLLRYFAELKSYLESQTYVRGWNADTFKEYYDDGSGSDSTAKAGSKVGLIVGTVLGAVVVVGGVAGFIIWKRLKRDDWNIL